MIQNVKDKSYIEYFVKIYNSSIMLFQESERGSGSPEIFVPQFENDENYAYIDADGEITAFMSYHDYGLKKYELTSLYVSLSSQRKGIGRLLIHFLEEQLPEGSIIFVQVLKNAIWSMKFYHVMGYQAVGQNEEKEAVALNITEQPWSTVLYKKIPFHR